MVFDIKERIPLSCVWSVRRVGPFWCPSLLFLCYFSLTRSLLRSFVRPRDRRAGKSSRGEGAPGPRAGQEGGAVNQRPQKRNAKQRKGIGRLIDVGGTPSLH